MPIEAWEKKVGRKLEDGLYRGTLRRGHAAGCGCALGENGEESTSSRSPGPRISLPLARVAPQLSSTGRRYRWARYLELAFQVSLSSLSLSPLNFPR